VACLGVARKASRRRCNSSQAGHKGNTIIEPGLKWIHSTACNNWRRRLGLQLHHRDLRLSSEASPLLRRSRSLKNTESGPVIIGMLGASFSICLLGYAQLGSILQWCVALSIKDESNQKEEASITW
jgi:hypothetical protein